MALLEMLKNLNEKILDIIFFNVHWKNIHAIL